MSCPHQSTVHHCSCHHRRADQRPSVYQIRHRHQAHGTLCTCVVVCGSLHCMWIRLTDFINVHISSSHAPRVSCSGLRQVMAVDSSCALAMDGTIHGSVTCSMHSILDTLQCPPVTPIHVSTRSEPIRKRQYHSLAQLLGSAY